MRASWILMMLLLAAGCPAKTPKYPWQDEPNPTQAELVLGVGDVVEINVWEQRDLKTEATIRADGSITMPLVGDLKAAGETPTKLKEQIKARLNEFLKLTVAPGSELVTVTLKSWRSYRFTVQGEVVRQGVFTSDHYITVSDAIAIAGGPTRFAKRADVKVIRTDEKTHETRSIPINYDMVASGDRLDMNIYILPGDVIYIP